MRTVARHFFLLFLALGGWQQPFAQSRAPAGDALVTFKFYFKPVHPPQYEISIHSDGHASYESQDTPYVTPAPVNSPYAKKAEEGAPQDSEEVKGDVFRQEFQLSEPARRRVFELATTTGYFEGDFDFRKHKIAFTGKKTLLYSDAARKNETTYNWSENPSIQELTSLFERISRTFEFGQRLQHERRFDKLGLNQELTMMEEAAARGGLAELHIVLPILRDLANDRSIVHVAQERAARLLKMAEQDNAQVAEKQRSK